MPFATWRASYATVPLAAIGAAPPGAARRLPSTESSLRARLDVVTLSDAENSYTSTRPACSSTERLAMLCVTCVTSLLQNGSRSSTCVVRPSSWLSAALFSVTPSVSVTSSCAQVAFVHDASEQREALRPRQVERDVEQRRVRRRALVGGRKLGGVALVQRLDAGLVDVLHLAIDGEDGLLNLLQLLDSRGLLVDQIAEPSDQPFVQGAEVRVLRGLADRARGSGCRR